MIATINTMMIAAIIPPATAPALLPLVLSVVPVVLSVVLGSRDVLTNSLY